MKEKSHIFPQNYTITRSDINNINGHKSIVIWFSGLSGSGKSTLANEIQLELHKKLISAYILDGDNLRNGLNKDLGFTAEDREENIRRVAEVSKILLDAGSVVLSAFISPFEKDRETAKTIVGKENFIEVYVQCPINICESRDVKGLYKKARNGEISNFTGISSPFEPPVNPDITLSTGIKSIKECSDELLTFILPKLSLHE